MNALLLPAIPLLGFAVCFFAPDRRVATLVTTTSLALETLTAIFLNVSAEVLGITIRIDDLTRLLLVAMCLASAAALAVEGNEASHLRAPVPLLALAPATGALITRSRPDVAVVMFLLALLTITPAILQAAQDGMMRIQHYVTATILGGTVLLIALAIADLHRLGYDPNLVKPVLALSTVGWGLLLGAFPFQFWPSTVLRGTPSSSATALLAIVRPLGLGVFLGMLAALPWLLSDPHALTPLAIGGAAAAVAATVISLGQRSPHLRLTYLATADISYVLVGATTGSALGFAGALVTTINHMLAMVLVTAGLAILNIGGRPSTGIVRSLGIVGLGLGALALLGVPPGSGFAGRWMIYQAAWAKSPLLVVLLLCASTLMLLSLLRLGNDVYLSLITAERVEGNGNNAATGKPLVLSVAICSALVIAIGLYPAPLIGLAVHATGGLSGMPLW